MLEKQIERRLILEVEKKGGFCLKFLTQYKNGMPDRLVLLPGGKCAWVELKQKGQKLRPLQQKRKKELEALGFLAFVVDDVKMIGGVLDEIQATQLSTIGDNKNIG